MIVKASKKLYPKRELYFQNRMKMPPERVADLQGRSPEHKWSMILAQVAFQTLSLLALRTSSQASYIVLHTIIFDCS